MAPPRRRLRRPGALLPSLVLTGLEDSPDATATAKMDGFDLLPRKFREVLNYSPNSTEDPRGLRPLLEAIYTRRNLEAFYLDRLTQALSAPADKFLDGRNQNR